MRRRQIAVVVGVLALGVLAAHPASAQVLGGNFLDQIPQTYQQAATRWAPVLTRYALGLFGLLVVIEIGWVGACLALKQADFSEFQAQLVRLILFAGFFYWLLTNSARFAGLIVNSMRTAAAQATGMGNQIYPSDVFAAGVNIAHQVWAQESIYHPGVAVTFAIAGIAVIIAFALLAAFMIVALVESYVIINAGVLFMGFGGSTFTKDIAITAFRFALAIGAKLFVIQLLVGLGQQMMTGWSQQFDATHDVNLLAVIGAAIVLVCLVKSVPDLVAGLISGSAPMHGAMAMIGAMQEMTAAAKTAAAAAAAVAAPVVGAAGATALATNAVRLGASQMAVRSEAGTAPASRMGRAATVAGYAARNIGSGIVSDIGRRLSGQGSRQGLASWRMAADLGQRSRLIRDDLARPKPSPPSGNTISGSNP